MDKVQVVVMDEGDLPELPSEPIKIFDLCKICDARMQKRFLTDHMKLHEKGYRVKVHQCAKCGVRFRLKSTMIKHLQECTVLATNVQARSLLDEVEKKAQEMIKTFEERVKRNKHKISVAEDFHQEVQNDRCKQRFKRAAASLSQQDVSGEDKLELDECVMPSSKQKLFQHHPRYFEKNINLQATPNKKKVDPVSKYVLPPFKPTFKKSKTVPGEAEELARQILSGIKKM